MVRLKNNLDWVLDKSGIRPHLEAGACRAGDGLGLLEFFLCLASLGSLRDAHERAVWEATVRCFARVLKPAPPQFLLSRGRGTTLG